MKYYLVKLVCEYADEFTCEEFSVLNEEEYERLFTEANRRLEKVGTLEINFGTNEYFEFDSIEELKSCLEIHSIEESEVEVFQKYFRRCFGLGGVFVNLVSPEEDGDY